MSNRVRSLGQGGAASAGDFSGRTVNVIVTDVNSITNPPPASAPSTDGGTVQSSGDPEPYEVRLQVPSGTITGGDGSAVTVLYQVLYWVGNARFATPIKPVAPGFLADTNRTLVFGNKVQVILWGMRQGAVKTFLSDIPVGVAIYPATMRGPDRYSYTFAHPFSTANPVMLVDSVYSMVFVAGILAQWEVELITAPGGNVWGCFYDVPNLDALINGTPCIAGARSPVMSAAGDWRNYGDDIAPGALPFNSGCAFALSATPDTFSAAGVYVVNGLVKVGQ